MAGNSAFEMVQARGWRGGLSNLLRAEFGKWWRTSMWWVQSLIWIGVINGILAGVLWSEANMAPMEGVMMYCIFTGLFPTIAITIILQDEIVGEKESGTAAWVLSKPVSRPAFVLSKLAAAVVGVFVTMILLPGIGAYLQISLAGGDWLDPLRFLGGMLVLWVYMLFYVGLVLMLGTMFNNRAPVIGIPLALAFGQQMLFGLLPFLSKILPWTLAVPLGDGSSASIAASTILGEPYGDLTPLYVTVAAIFIFIVVAVWRFEREEL